MCVIIAKTKTQKAPKIEALKNCFDNNSDGGGFMYVNNGHVIIDKGYMTKKAFIKRYKQLKQKFNNFNDMNLVIHCRIGTSGKNTPQFTHPYIITNDLSKMKETHAACDVGLAHNGILHDYTPSNKKSNDTMQFIKRYIFRKYKHKKLFNDITRNEIISTGSKFAILTKEDKLYLYGDFIKDGVYYSNDSYKKYEYYTNYCYNYNYDYKDGLMLLDDYDTIIFEGYKVDARYLKRKKRTRLYYDWFDMKLYEIDGSDVISITDGVDVDY